KEANVVVEQPPPNVPIPPQMKIDPKLLVFSAWDFTIPGPSARKGAFKIVDGEIRHIDNDSSAGVAAVDGAGQLHLIFQGHRKIPAGTAVAGKVGLGQWRGVIDDGFGVWKLELSRR